MIRRISQGLRALVAFAIPVDDDAARRVLSNPALFRLFKRMRRSEQLHSLRVVKTLQGQGHDHPDLLAAALLHDSGKSRCRLTIFGRTLAVLGRRLLPSRAARWAQGEPRGWRRPFVIAEQHPVWSAEDMAAAGASPLAVTLARRHQEPPAESPQSEEDHLLALLQAADNQN